MTAPPSDQIPGCLDDLAAWELVAVRSFLRLSETNMRWAINRSTPPFASITRFFRSRAVEVAAGTTAPDAHLPAGAAANILLLRGVRDLEALWDLGKMYRRILSRPAYHEPDFIYARHRRGYTVDLFALLDERPLPIEFADQWHAAFPIADLWLALEAGLTGTELRAILATGTYPDRDTLATLRGLRSGADHPLAAAR